MLFGVSTMHVLYFCVYTCSVQLNMIHMKRRSRNTIIIIIITLLFAWLSTFDVVCPVLENEKASVICQLCLGRTSCTGVHCFFYGEL